MSVTYSVTYFDAFTGTGGGGVAYYPGNVGDRIRMRMDITVAWNLKQARLQFDSGTNTISMLNPYDPRRFNTQGFQVGDTITVVDTVSNNGNLTIATIAEDGLSLTTVEALVTETDESATIHGVTPVTALDLYSNLLPSNSPATYVSMIDPNVVQKFIISGIATADATVRNMRVGTKYLSWVTNAITNAVTYETSEVTVAGTGVVNYGQTFRVDQYIITNPLYRNDQYTNFYNRFPPSYFNSSSLKHVFSFGAKFDESNPVADQTGSGVRQGTGSWFNQGPRGTAPLYIPVSISYAIFGTANPLPAFDVGVDASVTIILNSPTGLFVGGGSPTGTKVDVNFHTNPSDSADYELTTTTQKQNFFYDRARAIAGGPATQGENNGTAYQVITNVSVTFNSANQLTITFTFNPGTALLDYWESKTDNDRWYTIYLTTQNIAVTTTKAADRVPVFIDFNSAGWDKTDSTLFQFTGSGLYAYEYPDNGTYGVGSIEGFAGDPWLVRVPFRVDNQVTGGLSPTVKAITIQVLAEKTGADDFILEEKLIDCTGMKKLLGVQQILVDQSRGFISYPTDPRNEITIERDAANDTGTMAAYVLAYGLVLRYEDWISASVQPGNRDDGTVPDIALDIDALTQRWSDYSGVQGWTLTLRFRIDIEGIDGNVNKYYSDIDLSVIGTDTTVWPTGSGALTQDLQYFEYDPTGAGINGGWAGEELKALQVEAQTLVRSTYTGNFTVPATALDWYAWLSVNLPQGSIFDRRFASTEIDSEDDSPWSDPGADPLATTSYANGNIRMNIYAGVKIVVEGLLDTNLWGQSAQELVVLQRLGPKYIST